MLFLLYRYIEIVQILEMYIYVDIHRYRDRDRQIDR